MADPAKPGERGSDRAGCGIREDPAFHHGKCALRTDRTHQLSFVAEALTRVATHFNNKRPSSPDSQDTLGIIGFCGAPFTLASYMIEGASSRNYIETKKLMYSSGDPFPPPPQDRHPERSPQGEVEGSPHFSLHKC